MRVVSVVGARPQFIKAAMLSREIDRHAEIEEILVHTGQHYDSELSDIFFRDLTLPHPHYSLGVGSASHAVQTALMMTRLEEVLVGIRPECVVVYGDTNSTLAAAVVASKLNQPIVHVEAGLRSFNREMPEEINRIITDHVASLCLAPTPNSLANLLSEGIEPPRAVLVGDVMLDAALLYMQDVVREAAVLRRFGLTKDRYVAVTIHRATTTDDLRRLSTVVTALTTVSEDTPVVFPLHPRTRAALQQAGLLSAASKRLRILPPLSYVEMLGLEKNAGVIVTDSGGVQKEAYFVRVPCVTVREETEWKELVTAGWNRLAPPVSAQQLASSILDAFGTRGGQVEAFGVGDAASRIVAELVERYAVA